MVRVAVCHWGLLRTLDRAYDSHKRHIYDLLDRNGIGHDTYVHTWFHADTPLLKLDRFGFKKLVMEDETPVFESVDREFAEYWYESVYAEHGDSPHECNPVFVKRGIWQMTSQKRVTEMCVQSGIVYDYVIFIRPDLELTTDIDLTFASMKQDTIQLPKEQWGDTWSWVTSVNDVFAIVPFAKCERYGMRIDEAKLYRKRVGRLAPEHYLGFIVNYYFSTLLCVDQGFRLLR